MSDWWVGVKPFGSSCLDGTNEGLERATLCSDWCSVNSLVRTITEYWPTLNMEDYRRRAPEAQVV